MYSSARLPRGLKILHVTYISRCGVGVKCEIHEFVDVKKGLIWDINNVGVMLEEIGLVHVSLAFYSSDILWNPGQTWKSQLQLLIPCI